LAPRPWFSGLCLCGHCSWLSIFPPDFSSKTLLFSGLCLLCLLAYTGLTPLTRLCRINSTKVNK
jgi:hypothetical protein